ncbi:hypothetical protein [Suttonella ornithocola]|uniref:hypothetical protein n=1 Tax=Suttonella ornithocola TaxID=279832 RepID=UPI001160524D|nr:hypothetical protein [Suttonella ornithocola]
MQSPFQDTLAVLKEGLLEEYDWESIGFAGHPEGHPFVSQEKIKEALLFKQSYAENYPRNYYLMTQFSFTSEPIVQWAENLEKESIRFPLKIGIPGVASTASLIKHARACGVGASLNFLLRNGGVFRRLIGGVSEPNLLVRDLAVAKVQKKLPDTTKLHIYPLGGFEATVKWLSAVQSGKFTLEDKKGIQIYE